MGQQVVTIWNSCSKKHWNSLIFPYFCTIILYSEQYRMVRNKFGMEQRGKNHD